MCPSTVQYGTDETTITQRRETMTRTMTERYESVVITLASLRSDIRALDNGLYVWGSPSREELMKAAGRFSQKARDLRAAINA